MYSDPFRRRMSTCWSVVLVDGPDIRREAPSTGSAPASAGVGETVMVAMRSTSWPGFSSPPTARSSATVMLTARRSGIDGSNSTPGSRMEKVAPATVEASRFGVISCPAVIGTAATRPSTSFMLTKAVSLTGSTGTERITRSSSSISL